MTIAVTAAAGQLGHIVIDKLKQKVSAGDLLALVRRPEQTEVLGVAAQPIDYSCLLYTSPSPRDKRQSRMPSSA